MNKSGRERKIVSNVTYIPWQSKKNENYNNRAAGGGINVKMLM